MNDVLSNFSFLSQLAHASKSEPEINLGILTVEISSDSELWEELKEREFSFDTIGKKQEIDLRKIAKEYLICVNENDFFQSIWDKPTNIINNVLILIYNESFLYYLHTESKVYTETSEVSNNFLITNSMSYLTLRDRLRQESFADYANTSTEEIVFYTGTKGVLKMRIPSIPFPLNPNIDYSKPINLLIEKLSNKDFVIHFKNSLFSLEKKNNSSAIESLISNLVQLVQESDNNYELQLKSFSFEKFKSDLQKEKEKYFSSLREILNKILGQTVGVPISIAASTFASYKIENPFVLCLILLAFWVYVAFAIHFQIIYKKDVAEIESDFKLDFDKIIKSSGFPETEVNKEKAKVERRIKVIKITITLFILSVVLLTVAFSIYLLVQMQTQPEAKKTLHYVS